MYRLWNALFSMIGFVVVGCIPFATFFYGAQELDEEIKRDKKGNIKKKHNKRGFGRFCTALFYECIVIATFLIILLACYYTSAKTSIPVTQVSNVFSELEVIYYTSAQRGKSPYKYISQSLSTEKAIELMASGTKSTSYITYGLDFPIYLTGLFGWCGFWIFSIFVGAGLAALPFDLITSFIWRPYRLSAEEKSERERDIQDRTMELLEVSELMKKERTQFKHGNPTSAERRARMLSDRVDINRLTQMIFILERDVEEFMACKKLNDDYSILRPYINLFFGVIFGFISLLWLLHITIYMLPQPSASLFLNEYFLWYNTWFPIFGNVSYALFSLYLLFCTMKGCFKFGLRFICMKVLPVKVGGTYVDAFLFNLALVLFCTIPVIHFCTLAFAAYTVGSDVYLIFGVQIQYLEGFTVFYTKNVFTYFILLIAILTFLYLLWRPRDVGFSAEEFKLTLHKREEAEYMKGDIRAAFGRAKKSKNDKNKTDDDTNNNSDGGVEDKKKKKSKNKNNENKGKDNKKKKNKKNNNDNKV